MIFPALLTSPHLPLLATSDKSRLHQASHIIFIRVHSRQFVVPFLCFSRLFPALPLHAPPDSWILAPDSSFSNSCSSSELLLETQLLRNPVPFNPLPQRRAGHPKQLRRFHLIPFGPLHRRHCEFPF